MKFVRSRNAFYIFYFLMFVFQLKTSNIKTAYSFTPYEIDLEVKRMNEYPPSFAKLGYILETKKEVLLFQKLESNFFRVISPEEYFPSRLPFILSPFLFVGLYYFIKERGERKVIFYTFLLSIVALTAFGPYAKYGPILVIPHFAFFIALGFFKMVPFRRL